MEPDVEVVFLKNTEGNWFLKGHVANFGADLAKWFVDKGYCKYAKDCGLNKYKQIMIPVNHPMKGETYEQFVICSEEEARDRVGQLYPDNHALRIAEMRFLEEYYEGKK